MTAPPERPSDVLAASPSPALRGSLVVPGDKSMSHRALILGALAEGETTIDGLLESDDVLATARAVAAFGARLRRIAPARWTIAGGRWHSPESPIDCGNSGTGARLLIGAAAGLPIEATFTGDASLRARPMARVFEPLRRMGARIDAAENDRLPCRVRGGGLRGVGFRNAYASAQVKSALLLAGLHASGEVEIVEELPSRDHSERMLRLFGCDVTVVENGARRISLGAVRGLRGAAVSIPADPSSAAFPLVAGLIVPGSQVTARAVVTNLLRAGLIEVLRRMGARLHIVSRAPIGGEDVGDLTARSGPLRGVDIGPETAPAMIDEYPILAVAAAFAEGRTTMRGLAELRTKESDRLSATAAGLRDCGVEAYERGDDLIIEGRSVAPPGGARVHARGDHRIAMAFLTLGLGARARISVDGADMIATSFPGFAGAMRSIGAQIA